MDLFAGIGGIRMAFEAHGGRWVFTSEWNSVAKKTYLANFPNSAHSLEGDITKVDENDIPDHDVLLAGFPCQPFSIAGVRKKTALGRAHGFAAEPQGTLFRSEKHTSELQSLMPITYAAFSLTTTKTTKKPNQHT